MRVRAPLAATLAALLALAPALVPAVIGASVGPGAATSTGDAVPGAPKIVIVVGATHEHTASYREDADEIYAEAILHTPNVVRVYSPNATWSKVKAAAQGASILIYLGHGSGYPKTLSSVFDPDGHDGMGLNSKANPSDNVAKYYGESYMANDIRLAKDAVVILSHLCYASGNSEQGNPQPTYAVARERIDNFASGFLRAGARAVIADTWTWGVINYIRSIFTTDQTIGNMWATSPSNHFHQMPFVPFRNPAYQAVMDPNEWTSGFYRSIVGAFEMRTTDVVAGAAAVAAGGPSLWSVDGPTTISPNFDGVADKLNLVARFSGAVSWNVELRNAADEVVRTQSGSGHQAFITWDALPGGTSAPAGDYTWHLHAANASGSTDESGAFAVVDEATPNTGVLSFKPGATMTRSSTINYSLTFAAPISGLSKADLRRTGTALSCVIGTPAGGPASWTVQVTNCTTGSVTLTLNQGTVSDSAANVGPAGPIIAPKVIIDRSDPSVGTPRVSLRTGVQLDSSSTSASVPMNVILKATDSGSGVRNYDVRRSYDGGSYTTIANDHTASSLPWTMKPGHSYRFKVRATDKAGNVSGWATGSAWRASLIQQSASAVKLSGAWATESASAHSGGSLRAATAAGASASLTFSGRSVAWVTTLRPDAGVVRVYIDGALAATIDTYAESTTQRYVAFSRSWAKWGKHTIKLVVVGTAGRPWVGVDAFEVIS